MATIEKSKARKTYESIAGNISDRQWLRIKNQLGIESVEDEWAASPSLIGDVMAYAALRKMFPRSPIDPIDLGHYRIFLEHFPLDGCNGFDLSKSIQRVLKPQPSDRTIRSWGYAINCPLYYQKQYSRDELNLWVSKMLTQRRFKVELTLPKCKRAQSA